MTEAMAIQITLHPFLLQSSSDSLTRLFSSMFIHANIVHLAFNTLALVYLGGYAEESVGILRYIVIYILAGIAGALFYSVIAIFILQEIAILC